MPQRKAIMGLTVVYRRRAVDVIWLASPAQPRRLGQNEVL
jgi:hypothetical protein